MIKKENDILSDKKDSIVYQGSEDYVFTWCSFRVVKST